MYNIYREPEMPRKPFIQTDNIDNKMVLRINWGWPRWWVWLCAYLFISLLTFGYAYNSWPKGADERYLKCFDPAWRNIPPDPIKGTNNDYWCSTQNSGRVGNSMAAGFGWPLYMPFVIAIKVTGG